jgi:agmatine deiminase
MPSQRLNPSTPAADGFRMPAEWQPHAATWLAWPHNASDWPGRFPPIPWVYGEIGRRLAEGETVRILVNDAAHEAKATNVLASVGVDLDRVELLRVPTNRCWTRDYGPIFVKRDRPAAKAIVRFRFNAWAKYSDWERDDKVAERTAKKLRLPSYEASTHRGPTGTPATAGAKKTRFVLEGGAIDVNGSGTVITTEECLLDPEVQTRNPGLSRSETERVLSDYLGATNTIWLGRGIAGDDTHGHIDDLCRFVGPRTLVLCQETNGADANHRPLAENRERLQTARLEDGSRPEVVELPMPSPLVFRGQRLPASYANFYIGNAAVLVPTFNDPADRVALGILAELITDRPVVGIHAVDLVWGLGTLHCLTQQEPE